MIFFAAWSWRHPAGIKPTSCGIKGFSLKRAEGFGYMGALVKPGDDSVMRRLRGLFVILLFVWCLAPGFASAEDKPVVTAVRTAAHDGLTRFVLDISRSLPFQVGSADGLVAVELPDLEWRLASGRAGGMLRPVGVLRNWSYAPGPGGKGRLLLKADAGAGLKKVFILPPANGGAYRLVVDLAAGEPMPQPLDAGGPAAAPDNPPAGPASAPAEPASGQESVSPSGGVTTASSGTRVMVMTSGNPILTPVEPAPTASAPAPTLAPTEGVLKHPSAREEKTAAGSMPPPLARSSKMASKMAPEKSPSGDGAEPMQASVTTVAPAPEEREGRVKGDGKPIVVVDPGHGGVDPGAISLSGAYEKNIVLALAHDVQNILNKSGKVHCILTRNGDTFIPLRERVAFARAHHADLFMSLHADTVSDPTIRGLSVYTLSQTASDTEAQALADKENKSDIVAGIDFSNESAEVTNILIDLVQRESMNKSAVFAGDIIRSVQSTTHNVLEVNTHRFAGFAVLKAPDIPSVLVENGYLSNVQDEQMLRRNDYRAKLASALAHAIETYFAQNRKSRKS